MSDAFLFVNVPRQAFHPNELATKGKCPIAMHSHTHIHVKYALPTFSIISHYVKLQLVLTVLTMHQHGARIRGWAEGLARDYARGADTRLFLDNSNDNDVAGWHIAAVRQLSLVSRNSSGCSTSNLTLARQLHRRRLQQRFACMTHRQLF